MSKISQNKILKATQILAFKVGSYAAMYITLNLAEVRLHVNYKCSAIESSYTVVAINKPPYIHNVLSYYSLWQPLHIFNFL